MGDATVGREQVGVAGFTLFEGVGDLCCFGDTAILGIERQSDPGFIESLSLFHCDHNSSIISRTPQEAKR